MRDFSQFDHVQDGVDRAKELRMDEIMQGDDMRRARCLLYPHNNRGQFFSLKGCRTFWIKDKIPYCCPRIYCLLKLRDAWDYLVILMAIYSVIFVSLELSFEQMVESQFWKILCSIADLCFFIDILVIFRTAIFDDQRHLVTDTGKIAKAYLKGSFSVDFLSTLPFDTMLFFFEKDKE